MFQMSLAEVLGRAIRIATNIAKEKTNDKTVINTVISIVKAIVLEIELAFSDFDFYYFYDLLNLNQKYMRPNATEEQIKRLSLLRFWNDVNLFFHNGLLISTIHPFIATSDFFLNYKERVDQIMAKQTTKPPDEMNRKRNELAEEPEGQTEDLKMSSVIGDVFFNQ